MSFKSQHPDYKSYESIEFHVNEFPSFSSGKIQGFISRHCQTKQLLIKIINDIAGRVPMALTTNWGYSFLVQDLDDYAIALCKMPFPKIMDFFADNCIDESHIFPLEDVNELLENLGIGYSLHFDDEAQSSSWHLRSDVKSRIEDIAETLPLVADVYTQTLDHLTQAKEHLEMSATDRDIKDAIRDCLSAMESMLKKLSGKAEIGDATQVLRSTGSWGPDLIVKDGLGIWNQMHRLYPDIRHGTADPSSLTKEEAYYWLERVTCFIRYLSRVQKR